MSEYSEKREKAISEQVEQLALIRRCSRLDAWRAYLATAQENLRDSIDTQMEGTWRIDIEIAARRISAESGFSAVGADRRWQ